MHATLTSASIEWLADHRIFFDARGVRSLAVGDGLDFLEDTEVEPYVGVLAGRGICRMGFMSYSHTRLSPKLTMGRYCSIAHDVDAVFAHHPMELVSTSPFAHQRRFPFVELFVNEHGGEAPLAVKGRQRAHPVLEHDVWIGAHSSILPGVTIATGAVVGANSVVTRSVGPYEIVAGNPARLVRRRFSDEVVEALLESEWWLYRLTDLHGLDLAHPDQFAEAFLERKPDLEPYTPKRARLADMPRE
ncbi:MAG TPA: CatB-related O-acetyltransferase [Caulobacteraceae bacterium]